MAFLLRCGNSLADTGSRTADVAGHVLGAQIVPRRINGWQSFSSRTLCLTPPVRRLTQRAESVRIAIFLHGRRANPGPIYLASATQRILSGRWYS